MSNTTTNAICLFSGPGGVATGLKAAGINKAIGIEWDEAAVDTARAAGHKVYRADIRDIKDPVDFYWHWLQTGYTDSHLLLQGSPPCQGLSMAGSGKGREDLEHLFFAIRRVRQAHELACDMSGVVDEQESMTEYLNDKCSDERSPLTFEVVRWIVQLIPEHVMLEQVPAALPVWEEIGELLTALGYAVWTGNVHAEQFGVPQTRKRAMLLATRCASEMSAPEPTHSKYHVRSPKRFDEGVLPWVSMTQALGWGMNTQVTHFGDVVNRKGSVRSIDTSAPAITSSADNGNFRFIDANEHSEYLEGRGVYERIDRQALVQEVEPRVNNQSGTEFDLTWPADRPSPVVAGRDIITMPGANANRFNGSTKSRNDGIRVTAQEAGVLQGFPYDYPWTGTKTKQFEQVGNAVPPPLQAALALHLLECASESAALEGEAA